MDNLTLIKQKGFSCTMNVPSASHPGRLVLRGSPVSAVGERPNYFFSSQTAPCLLVNTVGTVQLEMFYGLTST